MNKLISTGFSPNVQNEDLKLSLKLLFSPQNWLKGSASKILEKKIEKYLGTKSALSFESARSALYATLSALDLEKSDEVLLQAYTCVAVPDAIIWSSAKPVYVDIDPKTFNMSSADLQKKISTHSKVLIIQHTFGLNADLDALLKIAKKNKLFVIEDCAHSLGAGYKGTKLGTFGDAAIFSFGRDKVISSVFGGIVTTDDNSLFLKLSKLQTQAKTVSTNWLLEQLLHPYLTEVIKRVYSFLFIGKSAMFLLQKLNLLSKAVEEKEKSGARPSFFFSKMPNALALLAISQMERLDTFNSYRRKVAQKYFEALKNLPVELPTKAKESIYLRFTIKTQNSRQLLKFCSKKNIFLGDWYRYPIAPFGVNLSKLKYKTGSCPVAEKVSELSVNLPTNPNIQPGDVERVIATLKEFYANSD